MDVKQLIKNGRITDAMKVLKSQRPRFTIDYVEAVKQYEPRQHDVFDTSKRPDKLIRQFRGVGKGGKAIYETALQPVARMAIAYQKLIVERLIGTMLGNKIKLDEVRLDGKKSETSKLLLSIKRIWKEQKQDFVNRKILRSLLSEMEVAEIWYSTRDSNGDIEWRQRIVSPSRGDTLYPNFDINGRLIAFSREYTIRNDEDKDERHLDTYMADFTYKFVQSEKGYVLAQSPIKQVLGKIPVVYYWQPNPEWSDVQPACDRQDTLVSNFADTNDYFASPMVKVKGKVEGFAEKGEQGKILELGKDAEVDYLTWDSGPEAIKTEFDNTEEIIYGSMQLPNFSFSKIKDIGNLQNAILKLFFTDPHMKAETKWEIFGEGMQRRLNLLRLIAVEYLGADNDKNVSIEPIMTPYIPENIKEIFDSLITATGGEPILSQKKAVSLNPVVDNPADEVSQLDSESAKKQTESFVINGG